MPIKGMFNQKGPREPNINDLDKLNLRMNALEVQIKKLLDFEKQLRLSIYNSKEKPPASKHEDKKNSTIQELIPLIEKMISEKFASFEQREEKLQKKIQQLESQMVVIMKSENDMLKRNEGQETVIDPRISVHLDSLESKLLSLEQNFEWMCEEQKIIVKQVGEQQQQTCECADNPIDAAESTEVPFQPVYIDKLYVDKYEQNNNFAQLGINSLSGTLNIGATYGSVPQQINAQMKKDFEKIRAAKEEMQNPKSQDESHHQEEVEPSSEFENPQQQETYTEIEIEED
ncbi:hypothetical protein DZB84_00455 [Bacillus sp. HNG]|uniref:hypothetical protein n=1 Tax=Bacillus sp. HNG TaxID=2293325 RepID=UPI000E2E761E|nr:hypothetical protein [Bacillus sp. HNG]RFB18759.1 hypothetical protein DZB84_00455 [Bacillus sp. HNG]